MAAAVVFSGHALPPRAATPSRYALRRHRDPVYSADGLPMACAAEGLPAALDGSVLFLSLARSAEMVADQPCACEARAGTGRPQPHSLGWRDRQPERENHRKTAV